MGMDRSLGRTRRWLWPVILGVACTRGASTDAEVEHATGASSSSTAAEDVSSTTASDDVSSSSAAASSSSSTGGPVLCERGDGPIVYASIDAPTAAQPGFGIFVRTTCQVSSARGPVATFDCGEKHGAITIELDGVEGLDLARLPETVTVDVGQTLALESYGTRFAVSDERLLLAFVAADAPGDLLDSWFAALSPIEVAWSPRECAAVVFDDGSACEGVAMTLSTPAGTTDAFGWETTDIPGGWRAFVSTLQQCARQEFDQVRFALAHESLLMEEPR